MEDTMPTFAERIKFNRINMTSQRVQENPNMDDFEGDHWKVRLTCQGRSLTTYFSQGYGHNGKEPEVEAVLSCLVSDAQAGQDDFEEFCSNLGYDNDSRRAERIHKACVSTGKRLEQFLGSELLSVFMYETEGY